MQNLPAPGVLPVSWKDALPHSKIVNEIKWNVDGSYLISCGNDKICKIASLESTGNVFFYI
jgi:hypothetical protein